MALIINEDTIDLAKLHFEDGDTLIVRGRDTMSSAEFYQMDRFFKDAIKKLTDKDVKLLCITNSVDIEHLNKEQSEEMIALLLGNTTI